MDLGLRSKKVLITGGTRGIGRACAQTFAEEGCDIVVTGRDNNSVASAVSDLKKGFNVSVTGFAGDLGKAADRQRLFSEVPDVDILVNNAGAIPGGGLLDLTMATWDEAWSLKVNGYIHLTQLYLGMMKTRGSGVIVNIIGGGGRSPRYDYVCGATGNAALMAFTGAVGGKSGDWGVRVFGINPSATKTDRIISLSKARAKVAHGDENRWEDMLSGLPLNRLADPGEIARTAAFLASPACGYVSGATIDVDGGSAFRG
jgi:NAD(P)-dependent dehydrogenase (short-subunit alcohol dehydrogenase family)